MISPDKYRKISRSKAIQSPIINQCKLVIGSLTVTAILSFLIIELAPSNPSQGIDNNPLDNKPIKANLRSINQAETSTEEEESEFNQQQLEDVDTLTNTMMIIEDF